MRRTTTVLAALSLLLGVAFATAEPAAAAPAISIKPTSGPPGTTIEVTGTGFAPGFPPCEIYFGTNLNSLTQVDTCTVGGNGNVSATFSVPTGAKPGGHLVQVCNNCDDFEFYEKVEAGFTVTPAPTTTTTTTKPGVTTTTTPGVTTSTRPGATTTTSPSDTSSTTAPAPPVPLSLPTLVNGSGVPNLGPGSGFTDTPIGMAMRGGVIDFPDFWLQRCGSPPEAHVVDFDDQVLGRQPFFSPPGSPERLTMRNGGESQVYALGSGTWTAPNSVYLRARPTPSEALDFNAWNLRSNRGFTYFGLMVGVGGTLDSPVVVELAGQLPTALDFADIDRIVLGPEMDPVTNCLVVVAPPGARFQDVYLRVYAEDAPEVVPLMIDHVYWSHTQPYPVDTEPEPAHVEILLPSETMRLSTGRNTGVVGKVTWPSSAVLYKVEVALPTWDGTGVQVRRARLGEAEVDGLEKTAWFWLPDVRVPSGPFELHASAIGPSIRGSDWVALEGLGPPAPPADEYRSLIEGQVDVVPWAMEVTQAVRGPLTVQVPGQVIDDVFKHVAGKRTVVRGYVTHVLDDTLGIRPGQFMGDAVLHGTRNGVTLPFSPLVPASSPVRVLGQTPGEAAERATRPYAANTFNFVLPYEWTTGDPIELRMEVNPPTSPNHIEEMPGVDGPSNIIGQRVAFGDVGRVGVTAVNVELHWRCTEPMIEDERHPCAGRAVGDPVSTTLSQDNLRDTARGWWKMYPVPGDFPAYWSYSEIDLPHKDDDSRVPVDQTVVGRASVSSWENWRNGYWDLYCDGPHVDPAVLRPPTVRDIVWMTQPPWAPLRGGGCAWVNRRSAFRANWAPATPAQEMGHTTGLEHTGTAHGELDGGGATVRFEGDHGQISPPGESTWGFDTTSMMVVNPETTGGHVHDFMSYGGGTDWISVDTWNHLFTAFVTNTTFGDDRGRAVGATEDNPSASPGGAPGMSAYIVEGRISPDGTIQVDPPYLGDPSAVSVVDGDDVTVTFLGSSGSQIDMETGVFEANTHGALGGRAFTIVLPGDADPEAIRIQAEGSPPFEATAKSPTIALEGASSNDEEVVLRWEASDIDSPVLIEASNDGGASWWALGTSTTDEMRMDRAILPIAGPGWTFRVQASDGVRVVTDAAVLDLAPTTPHAAIGQPLDGERVAVGMVAASAEVSTIGDDESEFLWLVDGEVVNSGATAEIPMLSPGAHQVTLRVSNAAGQSESSIQLLAVLDTDGDGLDDDWEREHGLDPEAFTEPSEDADEDGVPLALEYHWGTDPGNADSDGDGFSDGLELDGAGDPTDPGIVAGPVHGFDDGAQFSAQPDMPEGSALPSIPVAVFVGLGLALIAPIAYWTIRGRGRRH